MKKNILLIIFLFSLFTLTGCSEKISTSNLTKISYEEFEQLMENKESFVLEMMSDTCSHCESLEPKLKSVLDEYDISIKYIELNGLTKDEKAKLKGYTGTTATPTIFFYVDGEELSTKTRIVGNVSEEKLVEKFKENGYIK